MKIYTIIGGVNGVGKSSFAGVLKGCTLELGMVLDDEKTTGLSGCMCASDCLKKGVSFTQETTLSGHKTEITARQAREAGYYVRLYYIGLDTAAESLERIQNRVRRGGHDIPKGDVLRHFTGRWEAVQKILPYCDEAEFYTMTMAL